MSTMSNSVGGVAGIMLRDGDGDWICSHSFKLSSSWSANCERSIVFVSSDCSRLEAKCICVDETRYVRSKLHDEGYFIVKKYLIGI